MNYYNEIDPFAAQWLRNLIEAGLISKGEVDTRSIEDVKPNELEKFKQCHFFAGIGVWSLALRNAGWGDDRRIWTASCPCQPFSAAGEGNGVADERHLWPALDWLVGQCKPKFIIGEQVGNKSGAAWFDLVSTDLEGKGYSCGETVFPACGIGAPHIRSRQYWMADRPSKRREQTRSRLAEARRDGVAGDGVSSRLGNSKRARLERLLEPKENEGSGPDEDRPNPSPSIFGDGYDKEQPWKDPDWIYFRDEKWRPVQPGSFPLAHVPSERMGRLRGYGNAIVEKQAREFIKAMMQLI